MFDVNDDAKGEHRRVEVLTGPGRRRRWSADEKARIVAETLVPGARVSEVARRWQICSQQVFGWRRAMRQDFERAGANDNAGNAQLHSNRERSHSVCDGSTRGVCGVRVEVKLAVRWCGSRPVWMMLLNSPRCCARFGPRHPDHDQCPCWRSRLAGDATD